MTLPRVRESEGERLMIKSGGRRRKENGLEAH
jgi:hypothetical protein